MGVLHSMLGYCSMAFAQHQAPTNPPKQPRQVLVEGGEHEVRASEETLPLTHAFAMGAQISLSQSHIEQARQRGESLAEVLQNAPGLSVVRQGGTLNKVYVRMRGLRAEHTLVLLNGIPLASSGINLSALRAQGLGGVDLSTISLDRVKSIKILRGSASALYGPGAVGGVIDIRTHSTQHNTLWGENGVGEGGLRWLAFGQSSTLNPSFATKQPPHPPTLPLPKNTLNAEPLGISKQHARLQPIVVKGNPSTSRLSKGDVWDWNLRAVEAKGDYVFFDPLRQHGRSLVNNPCALALGKGFYQRRCNQKKALQIQGGWQTPLYNANKPPLANAKQIPIAQLRIEGGAGRQENLGLGGVADPRPYGREVEQHFYLQIRRVPRTPAVDRSPKIALLSTPPTLWKWGWQAHGQARDSKRNENIQLNTPSLQSAFQDKRFGFKVDGTRSSGSLTLGLGSQAQRQTVTDTHFGTNQKGCAVFLYLQHQAPSHVAQAQFRADALSGFPPQFTYHLAANRIYTHGITAKLSLGTGWRGPSLYETHAFNNETTLANPNLRVETSRSLEAGISKDSNHWQAEILGFMQETENEISTLARSDAPSLFRYANLASTRTYGVELFLEARWQAWKLTASANQQNPLVLNVQAQDPRYHKNLKPGAARHETRGAVGYQSGRLLAQIEGLMRSKRYVDLANTRQLPAYSIFNLHTTFVLNPRFKIRLGVDNLTHQLYAEVDNQPHPGRQWRIALRWDDVQP